MVEQGAVDLNSHYLVAVGDFGEAVAIFIGEHAHQFSLNFNVHAVLINATRCTDRIGPLVLREIHHADQTDLFVFLLLFQNHNNDLLLFGVFPIYVFPKNTELSPTTSSQRETNAQFEAMFRCSLLCRPHS